MKGFILSLLVFSFHSANAGTETHGGDLIVCYDRPLLKNGGVVDANAQIVKMELKDYWENKRESSYKFNPPDYNGANDWENVRKVLFAFKQMDYERGERLEKRIEDTSANAFPRIIELVEEGELPEVDDASSVLNLAAGSNCYDRQLAVQKTGLGVGRSKIFIAKKIFNMLDAVNRTGILLHELLLEDYLRLGSQFKRNPQGKILTDPVRYLNYLMVSSLYEEKQSHLEYLNILRENNLLYFDEIIFNLQGQLFKMTKNELEKNYPVVTATHVGRYYVDLKKIEYLEMDYRDDMRRGWTRFSLNPGTTLTFSLQDYTFREARIVGPFDIFSSLFEGHKLQSLSVRNSSGAHLKFFGGTNVSELTLFKGSEFYCTSKADEEKESFKKVIESPSEAFKLSSPEYIRPCSLIPR